MNKIQTLKKFFFRNSHVMPADLAVRFAADTNISAISFLSTDLDPDYCSSEEIRITKARGGFEVWRIHTFNNLHVWSPVITRKPFYTHSLRQVKALFTYGLGIDPEPVMYNQAGRPAKLAIVRFAEK